MFIAFYAADPTVKEKKGGKVSKHTHTHTVLHAFCLAEKIERKWRKTEIDSKHLQCFQIDWNRGWRKEPSNYESIRKWNSEERENTYKKKISHIKTDFSKGSAKWENAQKPPVNNHLLRYFFLLFSSFILHRNTIVILCG